MTHFADCDVSLTLVGFLGAKNKSVTLGSAKSENKFRKLVGVCDFGIKNTGLPILFQI